MEGEDMRALTSDERAKVELNLPLVYYLAKRYGGRRLSTKDKIQAGVVGLIEAVQGFDPAKGEWGPYAARGIVRHIWRLEWAERRAIRPLDMVEFDPTAIHDDPAAPAADDERDERLRAALAELPELWRTIVVEHYWNNRDHYAQARDRGCSRANCWQLEQKARKQLRARLEAVAV
jgi:RNA polymerase sigma factor (sigma-70 family)